jgi:hypothetical protein
VETNFLKQKFDIDPQGASEDSNAPLSYIEWKQKRPQLVERQSNYHYAQYVIKWFQQNKIKNKDSNFLLKQKYLYLLDQLQIFFTEKEKTEWYSKINLADKTELLLAIPFFAKKLKNIALYYLGLRKKLKHTKLKYNTVGTEAGLKQNIYNYLLTLSQNEADVIFKDYVPALSGLKNSLVVDVEELYDDKDYFDKAFSGSLAVNYNLFHKATEEYYNTKGISLSSDEWLFDCLSIIPLDNFDTFVNTLTSQLLEQTDAELYKDFVEKYLSENKFLTKANQQTNNVEVLNNTIQTGSNVFYYPYSTIDPTINLTISTPVVYLSSLSLQGTTGGTSVEDSDTIFVKTGNVLRGAWLKYEQYNNNNISLNAQIRQNTTTKFIFPYPGYGLSSEDFSWTGPDTNTTVEYDFLASKLKEAINQEYWNQQLLANNCQSVYINNTTLAENQATSNPRPNFADQLFVQNRNQKETFLPLTEENGAWLYEFKSTALPVVSPNTSDQKNTKYIWPYEMLSSSNEFAQHFLSMDYNDVCNPVSVNILHTPFAIASNKFNTADKIYKFNSVEDTIETATECCWLSGNTIKDGKHYFVEQTGFSSIFKSGEVVRFLWTGPTTELSEIFKPISHNSDCPFVTNIPSVSSLEWQKCSCKQVYYTPFGHSGDRFFYNQEMADFIAVDFSDGVSSFDRSTWKDLSGNELLNSPHFAWFQTYDSTGWKNGNWVNGQDSGLAPLALERGKRYFYKRYKKKNGEILPFYAVNYDFDGTTNAKQKWISAKLNEDGEWINTNEITNTKLYAGNLFKYERIDQTTSQIISSELVENTGENKGSIWSSLDYLVSGTYFDTTYISWPVQEMQIFATSQTPPFNLQELDELYWWEIRHTLYPTVSVLIESPVETVFSDPIASSSTTTTGGGAAITTTVAVPPVLISSYRINKTVFSFTPPLTGIYSIKVHAKSKTGAPLTFTNIPHLTVVPQFREEEKLVNFGHPSNGFLLEQPLYGWNYNLKTVDPDAEGAKPYWAILYTQRDENTKFKGTKSWGYPNNFIDNYLPNHHPKISPLSLTYGSVLSYNRIGYSFKWTQPIEYQTFNGNSRWCKLNVDEESFSNLSEIFNSKKRNDLSVVATTEPSDIKLSNIVDGYPAEVTYYAQNSFVWNVSVEPNTSSTAVGSDTELLYTAQSPWSNLGNRFYATIATIPVLEEMRSESEIGGYFLPQHLGASMYINKNFETSLNNFSLSADVLTEDLNAHIGGFGRSGIDHSSNYTWNEKNSWMKGSSVAGANRGEVKAKYSKTLQTFIPYEESNSEVPLGLINQKSRLTPWSSNSTAEWNDLKNNPESFTGIKSVSAWLDDQVLKTDDLTIDNWVSDIYGNQYGILKNLNGCSNYNSRYTSGTLWTRLNNQTVQPATESLSLIFDKFKTKSFYLELTGSSIKTIDCFFDTLMIETSSTLLFCVLEFDYENSLLTTNYDNVVICDILSDTFKFENTWLQIQPKTVTILFTDLSSSKFIPTIYKLDLANRKFTLEFPKRTEDWNNLNEALSGIDVETLGHAVFSYDSTHQTYLINYSGVDTNSHLFVIDFEIEQQENLKLVAANRFFEQTTSSLLSGIPPIVDLSVYGYINTTAGAIINFPIIATNSTTNWQIIGTFIPGIAMSSTGVVTGSISSPGTYYVNYKVTNNFGSTIYPLTITVT